MKIKILLKYSVVGAILIAALAIAMTQLHLTSTLSNRVVEIAGIIVFVVLGALLKRKAVNKN
ncbi:hypothetical protein [Pediococcus pentosaceus]|uniref:hypothetical protein n=1 Tax=Pediococcus pentosaceus TaxID=1255 RepID=UPI00223BCCB8|nr:hypothetical protein [Pediococcus pentosaceus]MCT1175610.1 hypothetical protein [Pediococcus pentosaceus]